MNSVTVLEDDNYAPQEVSVRKEKGKTGGLESLTSSTPWRKLADISNLQNHGKQISKEEMMHQQENMLFSSKEYVEKLQKENMTLIKALAHRNKIIEVSGVEFQKLRINLRNVQEKNLQLAQANSNMLMELNTNRDRLKLLQHELGCKDVLLNTRKMQLEEQALPCSKHISKDKVSYGDCKPFHAHDMKQKDTKRKRTSRIKPSEISKVKPINVEENPNKEDAIEDGVVSQGADPIVDEIVSDSENLVKNSVHNKRQCVRRRSTRFDVQETEQTEKFLKIDDIKETKESTRHSLRRRSARLRTEEAEPCKSFHERDEVKETVNKRRRVSSRRQSSMLDFQVQEMTESSKAADDDAGSLLRSEAVETSESKYDDTNITNANRRVSTRRQSTRDKYQTAIKELVQECVPRSSSVSQEDNENESKKKKNPIADKSESKKKKKPIADESESKKKEKQPIADESEEVTRRKTVGRPSRHAAEKVQSYKEVSLKVKMRQND